MYAAITKLFIVYIKACYFDEQNYNIIFFILAKRRGKLE